MKRLLVGVGVLAAAAAPVWAQGGGIRGKVVDPSGGAIARAGLTLTGPGGSQTASSGPGGEFLFAELEPGSYVVTVAAAGFSTQTMEGVAVERALVDLGGITLALAPLGETIVVSASKIESTLANAPATLSVVTAQSLENAPSQNFGDVLRNVPGVNVIQMSAREVQITNRQATSTLTTSQLTLLDGRSLYLDFFGFVLWDFVPSNPEEIKQVEVVRGPASAVWGANALTGVVNILTKSPRESEGIRLSLTGGTFDRDGGSREDEGSGTALGAYASLARTPSERVAYRVSGGYYRSDPFSRPVGFVPGNILPDGTCEQVGHPVDPDILTGCGPYPLDESSGAPGTAFENTGTGQPKLDVQVEQELAAGGRLSYAAGVAGTEGIVHTGIGPFDMQSGSYMGYARVGYAKGAFKLNGFVNLLDVEAPNLLLTDPATSEPVALNFRTQTFDLEFGHSTVLGGNHILSFGGNGRRNQFEITLTPDAEDRNEFGAYVQDEIHWEKFRLSVGGRLDKFGNIEDPVFTPRVTVMFKPLPEHTLRLSFNRAFRAPSAVNNYLEQQIYAPQLVDLRALAPFLPQPLSSFVAQPFPLVVDNIGNPDLKQESLTAYEIAYTGSFGGRTTVTLAWYQNDTDDNINFVNLMPTESYPAGLPGYQVYTAEDPPPGVPAALIAVLAQLPAPVGPIQLPRTVTRYLNLGPIRQSGLEVSVDHRFGNTLSGFANYSFQGTPEALEADADQLPYPTEEIGVAARHRFNLGLNLAHARYLGSVQLSYVDKAYWQDVLSAPFHGTTDAYTLLNASFGVRWAGGRLTTLVKGTNLANTTIQQHIFGDLIKRSLFAEVRVRLD